ncbi:equilibrative nucleotide transporter 1 [Ricinus communis]|uniref:Nucleoside transporter, putative n=1 Tax=Ricinus communis TaxID=3988 RepID=B9SH78_RICCO|nr:equilibrative nucleotide transporter 1 [Ricinus communis]EEF36985.1 nucleoside transporter, putative [Ricinus communis]|eukprot:XP_002525347.1 equilibrative nucleotide transporter 1 [Ricinus communis]
MKQVTTSCRSTKRCRSIQLHNYPPPNNPHNHPNKPTNKQTNKRPKTQTHSLHSPTTTNSPMGLPGKSANNDPDCESSFLLSTVSENIPKDSFNLVYIIYFTLGLGYLLPWNAFITAVDYFSAIYPGVSVDRVFAVAYMLVSLCCLLVIVFYAHKSDAYFRINVGLVLFVLALLIVPVMDAVYIKGRVGLYNGFDVSVGAISLAALADGLAQGGLIGGAGELPERYMQAVVAGTAGSGVLVSFLRIITKAVYTQDEHGLRKSANLYFSVGIVVMILCIIFHNVAHRLPVIKYYRDLKVQAANEEKKEKGSLSGAQWRSTVWEIVGSVKWYGIGILLIYIVTLAIFPGYITEDVHSETLKDWYPILLVTGYNLFDLVGKSLTAVYLLDNEKVAISCCLARFLFFPLFLGCLHGPKFFRTELPVTILTSLLGLTNGYLTSVLMVLAPKVVPIQHSETAGIVIVLFLVIGLAAGSIVSWFWVF